MFRTSILVLLVALALAEDVQRQSISFPKTIEAIIGNTDCDTYITQIADGSENKVEIETIGPLSNVTRAFVNEQKQPLLLLRDPEEGCWNTTFRIFLSRPLRAFLRFGSGRLFTEGKGIVNAGPGKLALNIDGKGNVSMSMNVAEFTADVAGPEQCFFSGVVHGEALFDITGSVHVDASKLKVKKAKIVAREHSVIRIVATDDLDIERDATAQVHFELPDGKKPSRHIVKEATTAGDPAKNPIQLSIDSFFELLKGQLN